MPLDESSLLIEREAAAAYAEKLREAQQPAPQPGAIDSGLIGTGAASGSRPDISEGPVGGSYAEPTAAPAIAKTHFYGTVDLDAVKAKMDFATIMDEVVQQFTAQLGVDVTISVEIEARKKGGFDESLQRTIKENCNVLKFSSSEFEED